MARWVNFDLLNIWKKDQKNVKLLTVDTCKNRN